MHWSKWKTAFLACLMFSALATSRAGSPCPVTLISGNTNADGIDLTFRNTGKLPIQMLTFSCTLANSAPKACHTETGLFFPGNQYSFSFLYPLKSTRSVAVSVQTARLSDGNIWRTTHRQPCKPLRISVRSKPA